MITLPKAISAIGHHLTTCVQSLLLFVFGAVGQSLSFLSSNLPFVGQHQQPAHIPSSASSSSTFDVVAGDDDSDNDTTTTTNTNSTYESRSNGPEAQHGHLDDDIEMAATSSSSSSAAPPPPKKGSLPKIIPALPLVPILPRRESSSAAKVVNRDVQNLNENIACLGLNGRASPAGGVQRRTASAAPLAPAPVVVQHSGSGQDKENKDIKATKDKETTAVRNDPAAVVPVLQSTSSLNGAANGKREVLRSPPVPIIHQVSQSSNLKETAVKLGTDTLQIQTPPPEVEETPEQAAERAIHSGFMRDALDMARLALKTNETPVGCVLVHRGRVVAKGMNATNVSRNGTRHAELMALSALLSYSPASDLEVKKKGSTARGKAASMPLVDRTNTAKQVAEASSWGDVDPSDGHLYPYGQKLHPSPRVDRSVINECTLYVTVEPCIMCASLLRQLGIKKVYFGAVNDKFGGTGGVFRIHKNSPATMVSAPPSPAPQNGKGFARPVLDRRPASSTMITDGNNSSGDEKNETVVETPVDPATLPGDGGNVERGYEAEGGWGRDEAVTLLRQFYVQENGRAPVPRKKEGRAARLAAMMERDGHAGGPMIDPNAPVTTPTDENGLTDANVNASEQKEGQATESQAENTKPSMENKENVKQ
ncbi:hypothetical protein B0H66DRAFT_91832 [Apodospora peruviana]|uniref:CMP/dCMP-type deaminase domain-containing protein n=1 Tax=Apodospora peruviana TaxID=516989 RepID=A0AAE0ITT0_9PEZI|nr:hypothetical protein B0H66DRAFT_91832 [Apodospora peruviana]